MTSLVAALPSVLLVLWVLTASWSHGKEPTAALALLLATFVSAAGAALGLFALTRARALAALALAANFAAIAWAAYVLQHIM